VSWGDSLGKGAWESRNGQRLSFDSHRAAKDVADDSPLLDSDK